MTAEHILDHYNYWVVIVLMMIGFYVVVVRGNLVKKIVGLNIFQTSVFLLYISMGKVAGGTAPILVDHPTAGTVYTNPLPSVLILTAIVVGVATTALGLALVVRIREAYGTAEEDEILDIEHDEDMTLDITMRGRAEAARARESGTRDSGTRDSGAGGAA
jgi:multicomponent Na+:H+ antiporter subunit C